MVGILHEPSRGGAEKSPFIFLLIERIRLFRRALCRCPRFVISRGHQYLSDPLARHTVGVLIEQQPPAEFLPTFSKHSRRRCQIVVDTDWKSDCDFPQFPGTKAGCLC